MNTLPVTGPCGILVPLIVRAMVSLRLAAAFALHAKECLPRTGWRGRQLSPTFALAFTLALAFAFGLATGL